MTHCQFGNRTGASNLSITNPYALPLSYRRQSEMMMMSSESLNESKHEIQDKLFKKLKSNIKVHYKTT